MIDLRDFDSIYADEEVEHDTEGIYGIEWFNDIKQPKITQKSDSYRSKCDRCLDNTYGDGCSFPCDAPDEEESNE